MREKPKKRIVTKGRYVQVMGKKIGLYSLAVFVLSIGLFGLLWTIVFARDSVDAFTWGFGLLTAVVLWLGQHLFMKAKVIEPVQPVTERNTHLLPPQETLVRSSDVSPAEQQSALLRAFQSGQETPKEQLLRSVAEEQET